MKKNICDLCDLEVTKDDEDNGNATCTGRIVYGYDVVSPTHVDCPKDWEYIQMARDHLGMAVRDNSDEELAEIGKAIDNGTWED